MKPCLGCGILVSHGPRCSGCSRKRDQAYDAARPAYHGLYRTPEWRRLSATVRAMASHCHWCLKPTARLVADHVLPVWERPELALDPDNLVASCFGCNTKRGRNARLLRQVRQVRQGQPSRPRASASRVSSVGDRMAEIFGESR